MRVNPPFSAVWKWLASFAGVRLAFWWRVNGVEIGVLDFGVLKFGERGMAERLLLATMMRGALRRRPSTSISCGERNVASRRRRPCPAGDFFFQPTCLTGLPSGALALTVSNSGAALHNFSLPEQGIDQDIECHGAFVDRRCLGDHGAG